jgi:hypothetical protein
MRVKTSEVSNNKEDMRAICTDLMKEMLWAKPPTAIEMFSIKRHMQDISGLKDLTISKMQIQDYSALK